MNELPQLKDNGWRVHGTADSGSTTTLIDAELKRYEDDYFTGGLAYSPYETKPARLRTLCGFDRHGNHGGIYRRHSDRQIHSYPLVHEGNTEGV